MRPQPGMKPTSELESPLVESTARRRVCRLRVAPEQDKRRSRLLAAAGLALPSSATQKATPEEWSDEATCLLLRLAGKDIPPCRLSSIRLSVADLVAAKESARMMPAIGSTA